MKRIAASMVGGVFTSFIALLIYPVIYSTWKRRYEIKLGIVVPQFHEVVRAGRGQEPGECVDYPRILAACPHFRSQ